MRSCEIQGLVDAVEAIHGHVTLYGSDPAEEHGICFKIASAPATFSAHTRDGKLPPGQYDIQIESVPSGDYVYSAVVTIETFLKLVVRMRGPIDQWPLTDEEAS